jgi:hypothetical protein
LVRTSILTSQNRKYARLHTRICRAFHRPTSSHLATTDSKDIPTKLAPANSSDRR